MRLGTSSLALALVCCAGGVYLGPTKDFQLALGVAGFLIGVSVGALLGRARS